MISDFVAGDLGRFSGWSLYLEQDSVSFRDEHKFCFSLQVSNIKKTLKATASSSAQEMEQQLAERECPPHTEQRQPTKKMSKVKGLVSSRH